MALDETIPVPGDRGYVERLDQNDPTKENVDDYLNNQYEAGEVVEIAEGTHTVDECVLTEGCTIRMRGTLEPAGDHPVLRHEGGPKYVTLNPLTPGASINTSNQGAGYTADAVVLHGRLRSTGVVHVTATGRRAVNFEQVDPGTNLNHTDATFRLDGGGEGEVGLFVDNSSGDVPNINDIQITVRNTRDFTAFGAYINAGSGNMYNISTGSNGGAGTAWYSGGGPRGAGAAEGDIQHSDLDAWVQSDSSNMDHDKVGSGISRANFYGSFYGYPSIPADSSVYREGGTYRTSVNNGRGVGPTVTNSFSAGPSESAMFAADGDLETAYMGARGDDVGLLDGMPRWVANGADLEAGKDGGGIIVTTPDGTDRYRIRVDNAGSVVTDLL